MENVVYMNGLSKLLKGVKASEVFLVISLLCAGVFHEFTSCAVSVLMLIWLGVKYIRVGKINVYLNFTAATLLCITVFYFISMFWAVDSGMAYIGHLKFLPVLLYLFVLWQEDEDNGRIIEMLPYVAAVMVVISSVFMHLPVLNKYFSVAGRLAGFFQYPNTFALFILAALIIAVSRTKFSALDIAVCAVLLFGLVYTGSRTVLVLAVLAVPAAAVKGRKKPFRIILIILGAVFAAAAVFAVLALSGQYNIFARLSSLSLTESTFVGRFLYYRDALPLILKNPFGLGYMGYYYVQTSVQTGVYSVMYAHNDILQTALDIGWIPAMLLAFTMIKPIFSRKTPFKYRIVMTVIFLHCCFDFDLQFAAMYCRMLLFCSYREGRHIEIKRIASFSAASFITSAVCLYMGISLALSSVGMTAASQKMYPWNTQNQISQLVSADNIARADKIADRILDRNDYVVAALSAKARYAYSQGDFAKVIKYKKLVFKRAPLVYDEYVDYCQMLINGVALYTQAGDAHSAEVCAEELIKAEADLKGCEARISKLGGLISDQMKTELPEDIQEYIDELKNSK